MKYLALALCCASLLAFQPGAAQDAGFVPMFNGKDLTGWVNVNCDPSTFFVKDGMIVTTGKPTGFLRTDKQYENFILEFDWMHQNKKDVGNSGLFVWGDPLPAKGTGYTRGIEVQVLVNLNVKDKYTSHGDLFSIWGATCKPDRPHPLGWKRCLPSEERCKGGGEWNHYKVTANDGVIKLEVNGKEVSGVSECNPRKGYLALESEGAECWFKNLMIKELPSTNPTPEQTADVDKGFKTMYYGLNLNGWKADEGVKKHWKAQDTRLAYDGNGERTDKTLWSEKSYGDFEITFDWKSPSDKVTLKFRGTDSVGVSPEKKGKANQWVRSMVTVRGDVVSGVSDVNWWRVDKPAPPTNGPIGLDVPEGAAEFANIFIRELK